MELVDAIADRTAQVCVLGLGYVGLPLARRIADCGYRVSGLDTDSARVGSIGREIAEVPRLQATTDIATIHGADVVIICVPTPIKDDLPDMSHVEEAARAVASNLRSGQLVILESTTYPGTTEDFLRSMLEESGLRAGEHFFLGFSPERIDPGNPVFGLVNTPKIVAGIDEPSTKAMSAFYSTLVDEVVQVSSPAVAEMAKLLENTYRHVNIALANEMAILCDDLGLDVWEVIDAASTKPFGFEPFYPGPGWGGHCIPVDPTYLSWRVKEMGQTARFVELATEFNRRMPGYILQRLAEVLAAAGIEVSGSFVLVVGVSYKPETDDCRHSPALEIIGSLLEAGARVAFYDPYVSRITIGGAELESVDLTPQVLGEADLVFLHTGHRAMDAELIAGSARLIFDSRNYFKGTTGNIVKL